MILDDPLWLGHREVPYREEPELLDPWRMNLAEDCCPCPVCQRCQDETNSREYGAQKLKSVDNELNTLFLHLSSKS